MCLLTEISVVSILAAHGGGDGAGGADQMRRVDLAGDARARVALFALPALLGARDLLHPKPRSRNLFDSWR